jgi:hypothetical protein
MKVSYLLLFIFKCYFVKVIKKYLYNIIGTSIILQIKYIQFVLFLTNEVRYTAMILTFSFLIRLKEDHMID